MSLSHSVDVATVVVPRLEANDLGGLTGRVRTVRSEVASHWWRLAAVTTFRHNIFRLFPAVSDISASFVCFMLQRPTHISFVCRASSVHCTTTAASSRICLMTNRTSQLNHILKRSTSGADSHFVRVSSIVGPLYDDGCSNLPHSQSDSTACSYTLATWGFGSACVSEPDLHVAHSGQPHLQWQIYIEIASSHFQMMTSQILPDLVEFEPILASGAEGSPDE